MVGGGGGLRLGLGEVSSGESQIVPSCPHSPLSPNTALSPEEAESALEAAHYFTEDSSSEGERSPPMASACARQPCWRLCGWPAALPGRRGCATRGSCRTRARAPGVFSLLFLLSLPSWTLAPPSLCLCSSSLSLPASPLASDLDLFLPWKVQGQCLGGKGAPFALGFLRALGFIF